MEKKAIREGNRQEKRSEPEEVRREERAGRGGQTREFVRKNQIWEECPIPERSESDL
jgi:hypothetical protein